MSKHIDFIPRDVVIGMSHALIEGNYSEKPIRPLMKLAATLTDEQYDDLVEAVAQVIQMGRQIARAHSKERGMLHSKIKSEVDAFRNMDVRGFVNEPN